MSGPVYLDHHATTPLDPRVLEKMLPYFSDTFGNPASIDHLHGLRAKQAVEQAREDIANKLGCRKASEIIFTSGATESNNLALVGTFYKYRDKGNHIVSSVIEHPCVLETLDYLRSNGANITLIPVDKHGTVDIEYLKESIRDETILVSIMFANNEIGTIEPAKEIGQITKEKGILFHTDAAQALGKLKISVYEANIDLMSFSAHKFYGPKGVGGLFVRSYSPHIRLEPIMHGGGHERGMRSGTLNVPCIVGMAEALSLASDEMKENNKRSFELSNKIFNTVKESFPDIRLNGSRESKLPQNLNITVPGVEAKGLVQLLKDRLSFSTGAACTTTKVKPSHVLRAIGLSDEEAYQTIRLGLGRNTKDSDRIAEILIEGIRKLKN